MLINVRILTISRIWGEKAGGGGTLILTPFILLLLFFASFIFIQKMSKICTFFNFFLDSSLENTKYLARFYIILPIPLPLQISPRWVSFEKFFEISFPIDFSNKKTKGTKKKEKCHTL
jgi:hypothetical protein